MIQIEHTRMVKVFRQSDFDDFARLSGDDNPIHTDPAFCAGTRFGRTVAHGLLLCSVLRGLIDRLLPGCRLSEQSVMFPAPTYTGEPMRFSVKVTGRGEQGLELALKVKRLNDGVVTCQGQARAVL
ncbi:MAG TPA: MaoC family dehydratase [Xanthomonadales bacterium]